MTRRWMMIALLGAALTAQACSGCGGEEDNNEPAPEDMASEQDAGQDMTSGEEDMPATEEDMESPAEDMGDGEGDMTSDMSEPVSGARVRYAPTSDAFFDLPFPSDARLDAQGKIKLSSWEQANRNNIIKLWFAAADELLDGWSTVTGVFVTFDAPIDTATLPQTIEASTSTEGGWPSVFLADVDPDSPERGRLFPLECQFNTIEGRLRIANQLGCKSPFGIVRRANTRYAFVVTDALRAADGEPVSADEPMQALLRGEDVAGKDGMIAAAPYTEALDFLASEGLARERVAAVTLFTTGDPTARLLRVNAFYEALPEPELDRSKGITVVRQHEDFVVLAAYYDVPIVQEGDFPYDSPPEGKIKFDEQGEVVQVDTQSIRVYITLPRAPMDAGGYPLLMFLHGSGGVAEQLLDRGPVSPQGMAPPAGQGPAAVIAPYGIAGFAADFQFHGMRFDPPDTTGLKLYNLLGNPRATVDNFIVAANEVTLHARLMANLTIDPAEITGLPQDFIDVSASPDGLIRFDDARFATMGQSMGSTIGLPAATVDRVTDAAIFSGSGGVLIEIAMTSTQPAEIAKLLRLALRYKEDEPIDQFDPLLHALQHVWDYVDPVAHAHRVFEQPFDGVPPKHVLQHSGLTDGYFSPDSRAAFSAACGVDLVNPVLEPEALDVMGLVGHGEALSTPASGNGANGVTAVVRQYEPSVLDGHHVAYQRDDAKAQYACFIKTLGDDGPPTLYSAGQSAVDRCETSP